MEKALTNDEPNLGLYRIDTEGNGRPTYCDAEELDETMERAVQRSGGQVVHVYKFTEAGDGESVAAGYIEDTHCTGVAAEISLQLYRAA